MKDEKSELRKQAEAKLAAMGEPAPELSEQGSHVLIQELRTHQIELEMQNEELQRVELDLTIARNRLIDLYDFSPVGYATLSDHSIIEKANLTLADLLGLQRDELTTVPFTRFIVDEDQDVFYKHGKALIHSKQRQSSELRLKKSDGESFWALIDSMPLPTSDDKILMAITDISARREAEDKFKTEFDELGRMNRLMVDRELRMGELRKENLALKEETAQLRKTIRENADLASS